MKLTFLGGADEVGATSTLVEIAGKKLLIDAGIRISPRTNRGIESDQLPDLQAITQAGGIDYLLVTHAHTDHTGALPLVVSQYPHVPVIMTRATEALVRVLQQDAQRIMATHYEEEGELPLFDAISVERLMSAIQHIDFRQPLRLGDGLQVTYHVSGHIAGAALLVIESNEGTLVMSGDVSKSPQRTVESIQLPRVKADVLVLESTYGGRLHANREAEERRLIDSLVRVIERGGKALIPAFALGRAQEVLQIIHAYRAEIDAPVFVDGMVRSVCQAYTTFAELLPEHMRRMAGDRPLFFRNRIEPVNNLEKRREIATGAAPAIIVASSGMLTGGASQFYARHLLPIEQNAVFLTGYQDEESPGKLLQKLLRDQQDKSGATVRLGKDTVEVRAEVGTYSLSAHADEGELLAIAKALQPQEVMLVHGDAGARHSLASALRQRQIAVSSPKTGTTREFQFASKPWAVVSVSGARGTLSARALWEIWRERAGDFFSITELARGWFGADGQTDAVLAVLQSPDNVYFSGDWRQKTFFRVNSEDQIRRALRKREIITAHPDLVGRLILLRNINNDLHLGVVQDATIDTFEVIADGTRGTNFTADCLVWAFEPWTNYTFAGESTRVQLHALATEARSVGLRLLPIRRQAELLQPNVAFQPESLLTEPLEGAARQVALVGIVLVLAESQALWSQQGLVLPHIFKREALEQNAARELALSLFPPAAGLRKVGLLIQRKELSLTFDFPMIAEQTYREQMRQLEDQSGWVVSINPTINQQALILVIDQLLPRGVRTLKTPSYFMDKREVWVELNDTTQADTISAQFFAITGFRLLVAGIHKNSPLPDDSAPTGALWEINEAYRAIREVLEPFGLYKASLKNGTIVLAFITPQVGERQQVLIDALSDETGYPMLIHPQPNQIEMLTMLRRLLTQHQLTIRKGPGVHMEHQRMTVSVNEPVSAELAAALDAEIHEATAYRLVIS